MQYCRRHRRYVVRLPFFSRIFPNQDATNDENYSFGGTNLPPLPKPPRGVPICLDEHVEERTGMLYRTPCSTSCPVEAKQMEPAYSNCKGVYRLRIVIRNSKLSWTAVGRLLDEFLTTRLSWSIIFEPRPHDDEEMVGLPKRKSHQNLIETAMAETTSNTRKKQIRWSYSIDAGTRRVYWTR